MRLKVAHGGRRLYLLTLSSRSVSNPLGRFTCTTKNHIQPQDRQGTILNNSTEYLDHYGETWWSCLRR